MTSETQDKSFEEREKILRRVCEYSRATVAVAVAVAGQTLCYTLGCNVKGWEGEVAIEVEVPGCNELGNIDHEGGSWKQEKRQRLIISLFQALGLDVYGPWPL